MANQGDDRERLTEDESPPPAREHRNKFGYEPDDWAHIKITPPPKVDTPKGTENT